MRDAARSHVDTGGGESHGKKEGTGGGAVRLTVLFFTNVPEKGLYTLSASNSRERESGGRWSEAK